MREMAQISHVSLSLTLRNPGRSDHPLLHLTDGETEAQSNKVAKISQKDGGGVKG